MSKKERLRLMEDVTSVEELADVKKRASFIAYNLTDIAPRDELVKFVMDQIEAGINEYLDGYEDYSTRFNSNRTP
jgi:hypothetical protein